MESKLGEGNLKTLNSSNKGRLLVCIKYNLGKLYFNFPIYFTDLGSHLPNYWKKNKLTGLSPQTMFQLKFPRQNFPSVTFVLSADLPVAIRVCHVGQGTAASNA